ncbi:hypothetical protein [Streptomyces sp. NPDC093591]|uniref:hypothetical protein n=1 Tax=Streptomyces sp. NPDC093591 TaxID=3366044 RepID=UPI00381888BA
MVRQPSEEPVRRGDADDRAGHHHVDGTSHAEQGAQSGGGLSEALRRGDDPDRAERGREHAPGQSLYGAPANSTVNRPTWEPTPARALPAARQQSPTAITVRWPYWSARRRAIRVATAEASMKAASSQVAAVKADAEVADEDRQRGDGGGLRGGDPEGRRQQYRNCRSAAADSGPALPGGSRLPLRR